MALSTDSDDLNLEFIFVPSFISLSSSFKNENWIYVLKNLERDNRLSGVVVYGCPYFFGKINKSIVQPIPIAYSPCQIEEAQNQILSKILFNNFDTHNKKQRINKEFTD